MAGVLRACMPTKGRGEEVDAARGGPSAVGLADADASLSSPAVSSADDAGNAGVPSVSDGADGQRALMTQLVEACRSGDAVAVSAILADVGLLDINILARNSSAGAPGSFRAPALWWAAEAGHTECVRLLLQRGADTEVCVHFI